MVVLKTPASAGGAKGLDGYTGADMPRHAAYVWIMIFVSLATTCNNLIQISQSNRLAMAISTYSESSFSDTSGSPPKLDPSVLALLDSHFREKAEAERLFQEIAAERAASKIAGLALDDDDQANEKPMLSVSDFRLAFGEDWQLSQFW